MKSSSNKLLLEYKNSSKYLKRISFNNQLGTVTILLKAVSDSQEKKLDEIFYLLMDFYENRKKLLVDFNFHSFEIIIDEIYQYHDGFNLNNLIPHIKITGRRV